MQQALFVSGIQCAGDRVDEVHRDPQLPVGFPAVVQAAQLRRA